MSDKTGQAEAALKVAVLFGLIGCSGVAAAADEEQPDLEFLEYLGSWEESDEEWLLFNETEQETAAKDGEKRTDPAPAGEESTELEDES